MDSTSGVCLFRRLCQTRYADTFPNVVMCGKTPAGKQPRITRFDFGTGWPFMLSVSETKSPSPTGAKLPDGPTPQCALQSVAHAYTRSIAAMLQERNCKWLKTQLRGEPTLEQVQELTQDNFLNDPMYAIFWPDPGSGMLAFVGILQHSGHREPMFDVGTSPLYPDLLPGMCHLNPELVTNPHSVELHPGLCLFISGCTGKCRSNTFMCLVKEDTKLSVIMEPGDLELEK